MKLPRAPMAPLSALGFGLIWTFLLLFVLFPLTRIFYDAVTNEMGQFTLRNFQDFFTDSFYLRAFWRSMALGVAAVISTSVIGIAVAFLIVHDEKRHRDPDHRGRYDGRYAQRHGAPERPQIERVGEKILKVAQCE